jgi:hypothetical protein
MPAPAPDVSALGPDAAPPAPENAAPATPRPRRLGRALLPIALFLLGAIGTSWALQRQRPWPESAGMATKWRAFEQVADEVELVFLGSSYTLCAVLPAVVEAELAARGQRLAAFNLGIPGLRGPDANQVLAQLIARAPPRLRLLVLELPDWSPGPRQREVNDRAVFWHTPAETWAAIGCEWAAHPELGRRLAHTADHLSLAARRLTGLGLLSEAGLRALGHLEPAERWLDGEAASRERGYVDLAEVDNPSAAAGHRQFRAAALKWEQEVRALAQAPRQGAAPALEAVAPLRRRAALIARAPFEVVQVVGPVDFSSGPLQGLVEAGQLAPFWAFEDPRRFPELYTLEARYDDRHLARLGAERYSVHLAARIAEHLEASSRP